MTNTYILGLRKLLKTNKEEKEIEQLIDKLFELVVGVD